MASKQRSTKKPSPGARNQRPTRAPATGRSRPSKARPGSKGSGASRASAAKGLRPDADGGEVPALFRINVEVGDLTAAHEFYGSLLGTTGRLDRGRRCYVSAGPVTLQILDVSGDRTPQPAAKALYFAVRDLDAVFVRARALGCLSIDDVHGEPAGSIGVRPWGERSFYAEDPWGNALCFVAVGTIYVG